MRVSLSTLTFDPLGYVELPLSQPALPVRARRMNRVATLDGGAVTNDSGYADADLTIDLRWTPGRAVDQSVERLVRLYARLVVATPDGAFLSAIETYTPGAEESALRLLVLQRLSDI